MDRNTIIGLLLIFAILIGYSLWMAPDREEIEQRKQVEDSLRRVQAFEDSLAQIAEEEPIAKPDTVEAVTEELASSVPDTNLITEELQNEFGAFAPLVVGEEQEFIVENEFLELVFSSKGAYIKSARLKKFQSYDSLPLVLFAGDTNYFNYSFFSANRLINTSDLYFEVLNSQGSSLSDQQIAVGDGEEYTLKFRASPARSDGFIEFSYTIYGGQYMLDHDIRIEGMENFLDSRVNYFTLDWWTNLRQQEKSKKNERSTTTVYYKHLGDEVDHLSERSDDEESIKTRLKWVGFKQQFFSTVLIADEQFANADMKVYTDESRGGKYLKTTSASIGIPIEDPSDQSIGLSLYIGPNKFSRLKKFEGLDMEDMIPLGWGILSWINKGVVIPVFDWLESFGWNYGIIILVLTILLKIVLFPIAYKTYISSAKMRVLKPEVEEISKKFPDQKDSMKKQQATMDLYRKAGVNPMAGCVPMLLQLPILIALFRFFPASIELRQQSFLWATDLSTYDSILDLPFTIPFYGDHVSLFTLLMTISTLIYTRLNNQMMSTGNQMPGMKTMMYIMPVMFLGFFNSYASGLSYYYFLANVITFGQMFIFRQVINEDKLRAKIEKNKKKPRKKSSFQKRLEDMQKQQQKSRKRR